jgi:hypothetical protein
MAVPLNHAPVAIGLGFLWDFGSTCAGMSGELRLHWCRASARNATTYAHLGQRFRGAGTIAGLKVLKTLAEAGAPSERGPAIGGSGSPRSTVSPCRLRIFGGRPRSHLGDDDGALAEDGAVAHALRTSYIHAAS